MRYETEKDIAGILIGIMSVFFIAAAIAVGIGRYPPAFILAIIGWVCGFTAMTIG